MIKFRDLLISDKKIGSTRINELSFQEESDVTVIRHSVSNYKNFASKYCDQILKTSGKNQELITKIKGWVFLVPVFFAGAMIFFMYAMNFSIGSLAYILGFLIAFITLFFQIGIYFLFARMMHKHVHYTLQVHLRDEIIN